jgi:uncharacterized protein (UPF0333 family)
MVPSNLKEWLIAIGLCILLAAAGAGIYVGAQNGAHNMSSGSAATAVQNAQVSYQVSNDQYGTLAQLEGGSKPALVLSSDTKAVVATDGNNFCAVTSTGGGAPAWVYANAPKPVSTMPDAATAGIACPAAP